MYSCLPGSGPMCVIPTVTITERSGGIQKSTSEESTCLLPMTEGTLLSANHTYSEANNLFLGFGVTGLI